MNGDDNLFWYIIILWIIIGIASRGERKSVPDDLTISVLYNEWLKQPGTIEQTVPHDTDESLELSFTITKHDSTDKIILSFVKQSDELGLFEEVKWQRKKDVGFCSISYRNEVLEAITYPETSYGKGGLKMDVQDRYNAGQIYTKVKIWVGDFSDTSLEPVAITYLQATK